MGYPIWTPSSVTKAGIIDAASGNPSTSPVTKCAVQPGLIASSMRRRVESASWELEARSTGSHCGGQATGWSLTRGTIQVPTHGQALTSATEQSSTRIAG